MSKYFPYLALVGELMVVVGAMLWVTQWTGTGWLFAVGSILFAVGRLAGASGDANMSTNPQYSLQLRRLYRQRMVGAVLVLLAAVLMNVHEGFIFFGVYLRTSVWLIPFVVFVVIELYTAFRIPVVEKNEQNK